jgi:acetolactate synthase-1/2/3 large subunit
VLPAAWHRHWKAFAAGGLHLVVVPVDYSENVRVLVDELANMQQ